jgi:protein-tyrosine sulfotransferase
MGGIDEKIKQIDKLLEKRDGEYPARGSAWRQLDKKLRQFFNLLLKKVDIDWAPDNLRTEEIIPFIESPVFICGPGRSGTTLLAQLLDGHPNLYVMPGDSNYMGRFYKKTWKFHSLALYWIKRLINPLGQKPFWLFGKDPKNYKRFILYLKHFVEQGMEPFMAVVSAMYATAGKENQTRYWVEKTPGNEEYVDSIIKKFPNVKFIHIIRDPLENLVSLKKFSLLRKSRFNATDGASRIKSLIDLGWKNRDQLGQERYLIVHYENLINSLLENLKTICNFLEINFSDSLCTPTVHSIPASSNSSHRERIKVGEVVKQNRTSRWAEYFTEDEKESMVSILYETALKCGYSEWEEEKIKKYSRKEKYHT